MITRCKKCTMPTSRPDTAFQDGLCSACISYAKRPTVDWDARRQELVRLLEHHHRGGASEFDCVVPSSGGKDSTFQVMTLLELGARPLVVTASTCMLTPVGRRNIDNLARHATTIEVGQNKTVRAKLNRLGLSLVGDISWPEHVAIFTTPFRLAAEMDIRLIFYGENPQEAYGGPMGSDEAKTMTRRWVTEFGGFLGLRPDDMVGQLGITKRDMIGYTPPYFPPPTKPKSFYNLHPEAHFLGAYVRWDSHRNAEVARAAGMYYPECSPCEASLWPFENLDNAMTGIHDHLMFRKYGYGRLCAQASVDVREGRLTRDEAMDLVEKRDGMFPWIYAGVLFEQVLAQIDMGQDEFWQIADAFTAPELKFQMRRLCERP